MIAAWWLIPAELAGAGAGVFLLAILIFGKGKDGGE